jgi:hypothetical protein
MGVGIRRVRRLDAERGGAVTTEIRPRAGEAPGDFIRRAELAQWMERCACEPCAHGDETCIRGGLCEACKATRRAAVTFFSARSLGLSVEQWDERLALLRSAPAAVSA